MFSASLVILNRPLGDIVLVVLCKIHEEINASQISAAEMKHHFPLHIKSCGLGHINLCNSTMLVQSSEDKGYLELQK